MNRAPRAEPAVKAVRKRPDSAVLAPSWISRRGAVGNSWKAAKKVMKVMAETRTKFRVNSEARAGVATIAFSIA